MDLQSVKEELLSLYQIEREEAFNHAWHTAADSLKLAATRISAAETCSELLQLMVHDCVNTLAFVERVEPFAHCLQAHISEKVLNEAGIYLDQLPEGVVREEQEYLFINTSQKRMASQLDVDARVAFLGRWSVEARQAFVEAFSGTHVTLRDDKANAHLLGANTSVIQLPECYYQPVDLTDVGQELERVLVKEGGDAALRFLTERIDEPKVMNLQKLQASVVHVRGDEVVANSDRYTLVLEEEQGLKLYLRYSEQEVAQALRDRTDLNILHTDVWELNTALKRDEFLKLPNERLVIGQNYRDEDVSLEINVPVHSYRCHNLYFKKGDLWTPFLSSIQMNPHASFNDEIRLIKFQLSDYLKQAPVKERKSVLKR